MAGQSIERRDVLRILAMAATASQFPGFKNWAFAHDHTDDEHHLHAIQAKTQAEAYKPQFFTGEEYRLLARLTELIIPTDETPGAREAHCAHFIDFVLDGSSEAAPDVQRQWREAMRALRESGFHAATPERREALVAAMARPERERGASHPAYFAYRLVKQQNTFAFYTSRAGLIEALDYKGNTFNATFPPCEHPEHRVVE